MVDGTESVLSGQANEVKEEWANRERWWLSPRQQKMRNGARSALLIPSRPWTRRRELRVAGWFHLGL